MCTLQDVCCDNQQASPLTLLSLLFVPVANSDGCCRSVYEGACVFAGQALFSQPQVATLTKLLEVVGMSYKAAGFISALVAHVNSSLSSQQQISSQQAETLQTAAGNVGLLLGLEAVQDSALSDDLNDVLEIDAKMNSKQILEVRRCLRDYCQQPSAAGP